MLSFRKANLNDVELYFDWANDTSVREQSYNSATINFENHEKWFKSKLDDDSCLLLLFQNEEGENIGQVRIQKKMNFESVINISIDSKFRGRSYAKQILNVSTDFFLFLNPNFKIFAFVKKDNLFSKFALEKSGFKLKVVTDETKDSSLCYIKEIN